MSFKWTEKRLRRLRTAVDRFNAINDANNQPLARKDFDSYVTTIRSTSQFNKALHSLEIVTPESLSEKVDFRGVEITKYERQQILNQMQSINTNKRIRLNELNKILTDKAGRYNAWSEIETLSTPRTLPVRFESQQAFIKFRESLDKQTYRDEYGDTQLLHNFTKGVTENLTEQDATTVMAALSEFSPRQFYDLYMSESLDIGFTYGPIASQDKTRSILNAINRFKSKTG